jgi:hypothetical protein
MLFSLRTRRRVFFCPYSYMYTIKVKVKYSKLKLSIYFSAAHKQ